MQESNSKKSGCGNLILFGTFALLTFGAGYWYSRNILGQELTTNSGAKILPENVVMTSFVSTDVNKWSKINQLVTPKAQKLISENLSQLEREIDERNLDINYQQDIQPWLGGIMFAILPSQENPNYDLVTIVGIKDKFQAWNFGRKHKQDFKKIVNQTTYKNVNIYEYKNSDGSKIWTTLFKNYVVFASQKASIEKVIDTVNGETSLAEKTKFNNLATQELNLNNVLIQFYLPDYSNLVENIINQGIIGSKITPKTEAELKQVKSIVAGIGIEDNSLHFRGIANLNQPVDLNTIKPVSGNLLKQMPQNTILMLNGDRINQAWSKITENSETIPELDEIISQSREQLSHWLKLDLDQDIFGWIDGEFAIGLFPVNNNNLGGLVLLETSNRLQGETTLTKLENLSNQIPFLFIEEQNIEGITVKEWTTLQHSLLSYGWINNNSLKLTFGTDFNSISNPNNPNSGNSILDNETFKLTTKYLPKDNLGYFYWDLDETLSLANNLPGNIPNSIPYEAKTILDSFKAITLTTSMVNPSTSQVDLILSFKSLPTTNTPN
jgi:hypothetical protein